MTSTSVPAVDVSEHEVQPRLRYHDTACTPIHTPEEKGVDHMIPQSAGDTPFRHEYEYATREIQE